MLTTTFIYCIIIVERRELMTSAERVKMIRNFYSLSQTAFGEQLGVSKSVIVNLELARTELKPLLFRHICKIFSVNPLWLETGEGEMIIETDKTIIEDLQLQYSLSDSDIKILTKILDLSDEDRKKIAEAIRLLANTLNVDD